MVFAQIMAFASQDVLKNIVRRYNGDYKKKNFTTWNHFLCIAFGQLTHRKSMSDTMLMLKLNEKKLYHLGINQAFDKATPSRANESRPWKIFEEFGLKLIEQARLLYEKDNQLAVDLKGDVFALDSTTIDLCLDVYSWACFRRAKGGIKIHTLLNSKNAIPEFIYMTPADIHDVNIFDMITVTRGAYYIMDKAYFDLERLYRLHRKKAYFVIRAKENSQFKRIYRRATNKATGIKSDWDVVFTGPLSSQKYPLSVRRIKYYDKEHNLMLVFLTNNRRIKAESVALLYKSRWNVEIFFKWIKQNLKIDSFWGQSENAVRIQVWVAISTYVLIAIAKKRLEIKHSLYEIMQYVSVAAFEKEPLKITFSDKKYSEMHPDLANQLKIF